MFTRNPTLLSISCFVGIGSERYVWNELVLVFNIDGVRSSILGCKCTGIGTVVVVLKTWTDVCAIGSLKCQSQKYEYYFGNNFDK